MPELEEAVIEEQRPSDEQATAFLNGQTQEVKPQEQTPPAPTGAIAPAASTVAPVEKNETQMMREELNRIKSELGQFRKLRSEMSQKQEAPKQVPQSWSQMDPAQQMQLRELVKTALEQDDDWKALQDQRSAFTAQQEQMQVEQQVSRQEGLAKSFAGEQFKELDPIMGRLYEEFKAKAEQGDEEAAQIVWEARNTRGGINYLVNLAKQEYGQSVEAKGDQARATQAAQAKKAGVTLGNSAQVTVQPDILKNLPKDPAKAAEILRDELVKRGAL